MTPGAVYWRRMPSMNMIVGPCSSTPWRTSPTLRLVSGKDSFPRQLRLRTGALRRLLGGNGFPRASLNCHNGAASCSWCVGSVFPSGDAEESWVRGETPGDSAKEALLRGAAGDLSCLLVGFLFGVSCVRLRNLGRQQRVHLRRLRPRVHYRHAQGPPGRSCSATA